MQLMRGNIHHHVTIKDMEAHALTLNKGPALGPQYWHSGQGEISGELPIRLGHGKKMDLLRALVLLDWLGAKCFSWLLG